MSEEQHDGEYAEGPDVEHSVPAEETGNAQVDAVLSSLEGLEHRPLSEQVAVFEAAHEALRAALSDAGRQPGPGAAPYPGPRPPR